MFESHRWKCPEDNALYHKIVKQKRTFKFLLGLKKNLDEVRGRVMGAKLIPSLKETFSEVRHEESRKKVMMSNEHPSLTLEGSALAAHGSHPQINKILVNKGREDLGINLGMYIEDEETELSVLVDRAVGGTSLVDGQVELMLHSTWFWNCPNNVDLLSLFPISPSSLLYYCSFENQHYNTMLPSFSLDLLLCLVFLLLSATLAMEGHLEFCHWEILMDSDVGEDDWKPSHEHDFGDGGIMLNYFTLDSPEEHRKRASFGGNDHNGEMVEATMMDDLKNSSWVDSDTKGKDVDIPKASTDSNGCGFDESEEEQRS
ncbi:hypothetical protein ZIOFF_013768 [Zingiber officinale]|uniref:Glycosyl hydrolase family 38 C-terminal domain-containing protein n=1 Tax=Zingiber officinale TaxID=94328 RepID=A0A8J5HAJ4_ZINOF|nr:hypothetical protein ZIOFF_013768 [Zingiber officinale]